MIPAPAARDFILAHCLPLVPRRLPLALATGCVLAETIVAGQPVPSFANSAMDGFAVRARNTDPAPARLRVVGSVAAGAMPAATVGEGEALRIMTGAPLPPGADAVCALERTRTEDGGSVIVVEAAVAAGANVRRPGEDVAAGADVFGAGTVLSPAHVGVLASLGVALVPVHPPPRVAVVSTGDELAAGEPAGDPGPLRSGLIRDANRPALLALVRAEGWTAIDLGAVGDDEVALTEVVARGAATADAVVATGGVSVGDRDVVKDVLRHLSGGVSRAMAVAVRPAKPLAFATREGSGVPLFGLPGNPVSALVSYELFVRPALRAMAGHRVLDRPRLPGVAAVGFPRRRDGKLHVVTVRARTGDDGTVRVWPSGDQGAHLLRSMAEANALLPLPDGEGVAAGDPVEVWLLDAGRL